jgi:transcriptional regulator with XRE-family HTH domain
MGMFANLGRTLSLLRELRGKSQSRVAREARIGKSQLSKYENGEKILRVLKVDMFEFFYTLYLVDGRASALAQSSAAGATDAGAAGEPAPGEAAAGGAGAGAPAAAAPAARAAGETLPGPLYLPPLPHEHPLLEEATDQAFARVFSDLLMLYRRVFEQVVLSGSGRSSNPSAP